MDFNSASKHASSNSLDSDSKSSSLNSKHGVDTMVMLLTQIIKLPIQFHGVIFCSLAIWCLCRLPTIHRLHIYRVKNDKTSKMMSHTFVRTVVPYVVL